MVLADKHEDVYGNKDWLNADIFYELRVQYRFFKRKLYKNKKSKEKKLTNVLYITTENLPKEYVLAFQKQYPDKLIQVLMPCSYPELNSKKICKIKYNVQNRNYHADLYKNNQTADNIQVYSIYSEVFEYIESNSDIANIMNLIHYSKIIQKSVKKLNPDIVHCENIPFFLGMEFEKKKFIPRKILQTATNIKMYHDVECFWAIINMLDKNNLKKLCKDKIIRKNLAALFGIKSKIKESKVNDCLEYLYENFDDYRAKYNINGKNNENILLNNLNERVKKLFPNIFKFSSYPLLYYSAKCSKFFEINSNITEYPYWLNEMKGKVLTLKHGFEHRDDDRIYSKFNKINFRELRKLNKQYILQEFSEKTLETQFTDSKLYKGKEITVHGYLMPNYEGILIYTTFDEQTSESNIKKTALAILNCFEQRKNIQVIFNIPPKLTSPYFNTFKDFLQTQSALNGRWIITEGDLNLSQFLSASDIIVMTDSTMANVESILYTALKYGCIPVVTQEGIFNDTVVEIFDDLTRGCGFIKPDKIGTENDFNNVLLKALNFYNKNSSSWNSLIKNAMSFDSSWDFDAIRQYNEVYENM